MSIIQNIRKDSGFEVTDKIVVKMGKNPQIEAAVFANSEYIKSETLTKTLLFEDKIENGIEIEFDDIDRNCSQMSELDSFLCRRNISYFSSIMASHKITSVHGRSPLKDENSI